MNAVTDGPLAPRRFAPLPTPPHDPYSLLLAGWIGPQPSIGWRVQALDDVELSAASNALVLSPAPSAERRAAEPSGSLGGLRPPINVAFGPRGEVLMLDPISGELKVYDACDCGFKPLRCTVRAARPAPEDSCLNAVAAAPQRVPANQLRDAQGLARCGDELFIADAGHGRILRFGLRGWLPRGELRLPAAERAALARPWAPGSLAFDGHGRLHAADALNQRIDRFDARGRWERSFATARRVWHIAIDDRDRLHALLADADALVASTGPGASTLWQWQGLVQPPAPELWRWDGNNTPTRIDLRSVQLTGFAPLPLAVDALGRLRLPCDRCDGGSALFDARGACVEPEQQALAPLYRRQGNYRSQPLDSAIDGCQWHRVELRGCVPPGCKVELHTFSAEIVLDDAELALLGDAAWSAPVTATGIDPNGRWDALIRSTPGRYLWLRLDLAGDGFDTPQLCAALVEYPRISLRRYLPAVFGAEPVSADFTDRFTAIFDASLRSIEARLDAQAALFEPLSAPAEGLKGHSDFLGWLASWIGLVMERDWPEARRRRYLNEAAALYPQRGTPQGLRRQLLLLLGLDRSAACCPAERPQARCLPRPLNCGPGPALVPAAPPALLLEHFKLRRWLFAGRARLGDDSVLWGQRIVNRSQLGGNSAPDAPTGCGGVVLGGPATALADCSQAGGISGAAPLGSARVGQSQLIATPDPLRDPLLVHANRISLFVPACVKERPADERALRHVLATEVPAHVQAQLVYVEPRFRVGVQAMVGLDSVIARTPMGVRLNGSDKNQGLGRATVLPARPAAAAQVGGLRVGGPAGLA
ncbi:phage tail protein [Variovorax sp. J22R24]|uniref:phage tail protein n=1 Tax=Variovorax gracilis TaxID=3053502 RepID=UPI0025753A8E|nr:phage tail protein [Variovorax sp. J22R24]MDM0109631.1 phage tail protein [Variovorax sp. J22R24]